MSQGEDQVGELMLLKFGDKGLVLLVGELAGVVLEYGLGSLFRATLWMPSRSMFSRSSLERKRSSKVL